MSRKTINVEYLKNWANVMLEGDDQENRKVRLGVCLMLEEVLMETGNYNGFKYLEQYDISNPKFDSTRRYYY